MARKRKLTRSQRRARARRDRDALHGDRRAKGGDSVLIRPKPDDKPSKVKRYLPDREGNLVEVTDDDEN